MLTNTKRITKQTIELAQAAALLEQSAKVLWDTTPGFGVRIGAPNKKYPLGKISYFVSKRVAGRGSKQMYFTFAQYPQLDVIAARDRALSLLSNIRSNININAQRKELFRTAEEQFAQTQDKKLRLTYLLEEFRKQQEKANPSNYWKRDVPAFIEKYIKNKAFEPFLGETAITQITKEDIRQLLANIPYASMARRGKAILGPFFKYLVSNDLIKINPMSELPALPRGNERERCLSKEELKAFWKATEDLKLRKSPFGWAFQLLLVTGQRLREAAQLERVELNEAEQLYTLQAHRSKSKKPHIVPLSPLAMHIITSAPRISNEYVFSRYGTKLEGFSVAKGMLDEAMQRHLKTPLQSWTLHDLRRTFASVCASLGVNSDIIERCLNHIPDKGKTGVKRIYNRYEYLPERKACMELFSKYIIENISN